MRFKEFGIDNKEILVLVHGFGITWKMFLPMIDSLKTKYHIIIPILDGHDESTNSLFESIEDEADKITNYLVNNHSTSIYGIYGVSLGGTIVACILENNVLSFKNVIIDAGPLVPLNKFLLAVSVKTRVKQIMSLKKPNSMYQKMLKRTFYPENMVYEICILAGFIKKETIINACRSAFSYTIPKLNCNSHIAYWYGYKEHTLCKKYVERIKEICPQVVVQIFPCYDHGELAIGNPKICTEKMFEFFNNM